MGEGVGGFERTCPSLSLVGFAQWEMENGKALTPYRATSSDTLVTRPVNGDVIYGRQYQLESERSCSARRLYMPLKKMGSELRWTIQNYGSSTVGAMYERAP